MRDLLLALDLPHLIQRDNIRRQPPVNTQYLPVDDRRYIQVVENLSTVLPRVRIPVLLLTLLVKPVDLRDLPAFVVSPQQRDVGRVPRLEKHQKCERFHAVVTPVDKVPLPPRYVSGHRA